MEISKATVLSEKPEIPLNLSLSVSKVKTFSSCKAKYRFSYIEKLPQKDWEFLVFGKFLHEVLENFHRMIINGSIELDHILMSICFKNALVNWKEKLSSEQKDQCKVILAGYLVKLNDQKLKEINPTVLAVEKHFYINIDDKILLNGFIDKVQIDPDGVLAVQDYKSSKDSKYLKKDLFQLLTYAYVLMLEDPTLQKVRGQYVMLKHNFDIISKDFTRDDAMVMEKKFLEYADQINTEKLWRAKPTPLCNYCSFLDICPDGKNKYGEVKTFGAVAW